MYRKTQNIYTSGYNSRNKYTPKNVTKQKSHPEGWLHNEQKESC